ncbi:MAG: hypothetical protein JXQ91_03400 [Vannielia sp.]|uniref:hypothetical protein n=1 Tax=Rhodobacterales TaxID=204455 RepID=UPI002094F859|nr:hypothetical protein [Oceanicola sp. 502str15]MCO6382025.1 hypothetical protein [Oceanicola sp. 502str15]
MINLASIARKNRETALLGLARRRSGNVVNVAFGRDRSAPMPVLDFGARRRAFAEMAAEVAAELPPMPMTNRQPTLVLVSDAKTLPQAA